MDDHGIITSLSEETGRPREEIKNTVTAYFKALKNNLNAGSEVIIAGFGKISPKKLPEIDSPAKNKKTSVRSRTSIVSEPNESFSYTASTGYEYAEGHYLQDYNIDSLGDIYTSNTKKILWDLLGEIGIEQKVLAEKVLNITANTLRSYKLEKNKELPPRLKELAFSIKELYVKGKEIFQSIDNFNNWLHHDQIGLEGRKPIELINTMTGIHLVIEELMRIEFGATA